MAKINEARIKRCRYVSVLALRANRQVFDVAGFAIRNGICLRFAIGDRFQVLFLRVYRDLIRFRQAAYLIKARIEMTRRNGGQDIVGRPRDLIYRFYGVCRNKNVQIAISRNVDRRMNSLFEVRSIRYSRIIMFQASSSCFFNRFSYVAMFDVRSNSRDIYVSNFRRRRARMVALGRFVHYFIVHDAFANAFFNRCLYVAFTTFYFTIIARVSGFSALRT